MSAQTTPYTKLPGTGHQLGSYTKLYRGEDHLLQVTSVTFSERYKRFYFRDIQALTVVRTAAWLIWAGLAGFIALLLLVITVAVNDPVGRVVSGSGAGVFVLVVLSQLLRGPTCRCCVQTAVQTERIPSLNRERKTRQVLESLRPLIEAVQGPLTESPSILTAADTPDTGEPSPPS